MRFSSIVWGFALTGTTIASAVGCSGSHADVSSTAQQLECTTGTCSSGESVIPTVGEQPDAQTEDACDGGSTQTEAPETSVADAGASATEDAACAEDASAECPCDAGVVEDAATPPPPPPPPPPPVTGCTLTQGYWKNHAGSWPVSTLMLGGRAYSQSELLSLFNTAPRGDASLVLAHQLIAAKLNLAAGASVAPIAGAVADADAWLSANVDADGALPFGVAASSTSGAVATALAGQLDAFNNGASGVPHCD